MVFNKVKDFSKIASLVFIRAWRDFKFYQITQVRHKTELYNVFRKLGGEYVHWGISDSTVEMLFSQFICFYERYGHNFSEEYLKEYLQHYKNYDIPKNVKQGYMEDYKLRKERYKKINTIWEYLSKNRDYNKSVIEELHNEIFSPKNSLKLYDEDSGSGMLGFTVNNIKIKYKFDSFGKIIIKEKIKLKENSKIDISVYNLENDIFNKDSEMAKLIIDVRGDLWD
jgi:hypothetical protein